jgi:WD40 repeat protein
MDHLENTSFLLDSNSQLEGDAPGAARHGGTPTSDEAASSRDIEECLKLLDEVWPPDADSCAPIPRQLGRFTILGELGRGGFGVVFLAEDSLLRRRVAVKVPRVEILAGSESWRRFLREARAASRLDHPNLVPLLEAGAAGPVGYIVSAYVPGPSLEYWLRTRSARVQPRWAARLVAALARGIDHVHAQGILHRDLKPANVLLHAPGSVIDPAQPASWASVPPESWTPKICDFGLAKLREIEEDETRSRVVCGSPPYMAPEQADSRRHEIGPATDVYGLGTILYELLSGRPPFGGKSNLETLRRVVTDDPIPPRRRRAGIPRDLDTICLKCLAKHPERRYTTAADLAEDLERFLDGRPIAARPTPAWERAGRWARRNPAAAALVSAVIMAIIAGVGGLLWHASVLRDKNEELRHEALRAERHAQDAGIQRNLAERQTRLLLKQLAGSQLSQAQQALSWGDFERARRLLDASGSEFGPPGQRPFPWRYLEESVRDHIQVLPGHEETVGCLAVSSDARTLASGDDRGEVRLWNLESGRCLVAFSGSFSPIRQLAFSPDGTILASADLLAGEIRLWDVPSGRARSRLGGTGAGEPVWALFFQGRGRRITAIRSRRVPQSPPMTSWEIARPDRVIPEARLDECAVASRKCADDRLRCVVDFLDGSGPSAVPSIAISSGGGSEQAGPAVAFTRDDALAVVALIDGSIEVFRNRSRSRLARIFSSPGGRIVLLLGQVRSEDRSSAAERKRLERMATGLLPNWPKTPSSAGTVVSMDGASWSSYSPAAGQVVFWNEQQKRLGQIGMDTRGERTISELGPLTGLRSLALSPDGSTLAVGSLDHLVRLWHVRPPPRTIRLRGHAPAEGWSVAFSPDGLTLASGGDDHRIRLWEVATGRERATLRQHNALVTSLAFSPDGHTLASGSFDEVNYAMLWDVESRLPRTFLRGHKNFVRSVVFSPDGQTIATTGDDDAVMLWDAGTGLRNAVIPVDHHYPSCLSFSPDRRTLTVNAGKRIILVNRATGETREIAVDSAVFALGFTREGTSLLVGCDDGSIRQLLLSELRQVWKMRGHSGQVGSLALSPDGAVVASASGDKTVRICDVATGQELLWLTDCRARVNSVAFSPDGLMLVATDHSGAITIWDARPRH